MNRTTYIAGCLTIVLNASAAFSAEKNTPPPAVKQPMVAHGVAIKPLTLTAADGVRIFANYYAAEKPKAIIVLFHQAGSNKSEYADIAPRLVGSGYSALAVDQRSGGEKFGVQNETVNALGTNAEYSAALPDMEAAFTWAKQQRLPVVIWGSSYSATLAFTLAAHHPNEIAAVMSFSPGDYLDSKSMAAKVNVPVFVTSGISNNEVAAAGGVFAAVASAKKVQFIPKIAGIHGSSTLIASKNAKGAAENWAAVEGFLASVFVTRNSVR